jgi:sorbitol-specific phosphotransferase system component IIBC
MLATIVMTSLVFILFMVFIIMFIVYFDYILNIVGLSSYSCICSYSAHPKDPWMGSRYCVSVVLICCLPVDSPYIPTYVVDHGCDTLVESFVVHSPM